MRRSRLELALVMSLLLHAGALLWLALRTPPPEPATPRPAPIEVQITHVEPPKPAPVPAPVAPAAPAPAPHHATRPSAATPPAPAPPPSASPASTARPPDAPLALVPRSDFVVPGTPVEPPRGHTLHPTDPQFQPEALRAEEEKRVHARVDGWTRDTLAEARAQNGLPNPYFWRVRDAAVAGLGRRAKEAGIAPTGSAVMLERERRLADAASSYAKTGNPNLGPVSDAPTQSEIIKDRFGNTPESNAVRALVQATETQEALTHNKPQLHLTIELRQFQDGSKPQALLLERSHDNAFDAFVLAEWPKAMDSAGPPPATLFQHGPVLRTVWSVEGWLEMPKKMAEALSMLPAPGVMGFSSEQIAPMLTKEGYHYEFHARLLRSYE